MIALRSFVYFGFVTFIPLYYIHDLHTGKAAGSAALSVMLVGGAAGTLLGGPLADRFGRRAVLRGSMAVLPALIVGFLCRARRSRWCSRRWPEPPRSPPSRSRS